MVQRFWYRSLDGNGRSYQRSGKVARKFRGQLTSAQIQFARAVEAAGIDTYVNAVKAIERDEYRKVQAWTEALRGMQSVSAF